MSNTHEIKAVKQEIKRLKDARQSSRLRDIDIINLMNAQSKLRDLFAEAEKAARGFKKKA